MGQPKTWTFVLLSIYAERAVTSPAPILSMTRVLDLTFHNGSSLMLQAGGEGVWRLLHFCPFLPENGRERRRGRGRG